ncbi:MAG: hypothetical protein AABX82_02645 [Nanoarchaeota archaeon]
MKSIDIIFPKNNEEEFISIAKALGTKELIFVYTQKEYKEYHSKEIKIKTAVVVIPKEALNAQKKYPLLVIKADQETDLWVIEHIKNVILYGFELQDRRDFMHHRNSGINHIVAKQIKEKGIVYGFPISILFHAPADMQATLLGRLRQSINILRKYKVDIILASFSSDPMDMRNGKDVWGLA